MVDDGYGPRLGVFRERETSCSHTCKLPAFHFYKPLNKVQFIAYIVIYNGNKLTLFSNVSYILRTRHFD